MAVARRASPSQRGAGDAGDGVAGRAGVAGGRPTAVVTHGLSAEQDRAAADRPLSGRDTAASARKEKEEGLMYTALLATSQTLADFIQKQLENDPTLRTFFNAGLGGTMVVSLGNPEEMSERNEQGLSL